MSENYARLSPIKTASKAVSMVAARTVGLLIGATGTIWAARCLGPANGGLAGLVIATSLQVNLLSTILHPTVLIRDYKEKHHADPQDLIGSSATFTFFFVLTIAIVVGFATSLHLIQAAYKPYIALFLVITSATAIQPSWIFQASERQHFQSAISIIQPLLASSLYWIFFHPGVHASSDLLVNAFVSIVIAGAYWTGLFTMGIVRSNPISFRYVSLILKLIYHSRWYFLLNLAVYTYTMLELPLVGWLYSVSALGKYRTAFTIVASAQSVFNIVPMILYPRFLSWRREGEDMLWNRQNSIFRYLLMAAVPLCFAIVLAVPPTYTLIYGVAFADGGVPCAILMCSKIIVLLNGIYFWGLATDRKYDRALTVWMCGVATLSLLADVLLIPIFGMMGASLIDLSSELAILLICWCLAIRRIKAIRINQNAD